MTLIQPPATAPFSTLPRSQLRVNAGDPSLMRELIEAFLKNAPELVVALAGDDTEEVRRAAHTLKANARTFGATELADLCQKLEERARAGELDGVQSWRGKSRSNTSARPSRLWP